MKKFFLLLVLSLPLMVFSHEQDNQLFSGGIIEPGVVVLLDKSTSMTYLSTEYDTSTVFARSDVVLSGYNWYDHSTELEGWYDSGIFPDGPGEMTYFEGVPADTIWILRINGSGRDDTTVVNSWTLRLYQGGSYTDFSGSSFGLEINSNEISDTIDITGIGTIDSLECYVDVDCYSFQDSSWNRWRRRWDYFENQTEMGEISIALNGPCFTDVVTGTTMTRMQAAILVIHSLLDADGDGFVTEADEELLPVELGFGFHREDVCYVPEGTPSSYTGNLGQGYDEATGNWVNLGNGTINADPIGSSFVDIWNDANTTTTGMWTPNGTLINKATTYIQSFRSVHAESLWCMKHNIILVTDGWTTSSDGECGSCNLMNQSNCSRDVVLKAYRAWEEDSVRVFAVGFGTDIDVDESNELNWIARWGGTCADPSAVSGDPMAVDPTGGCPTAIPYNEDLSGYAYIAHDATALAGALQEIFTEIVGQREKSFSSVEINSIEEDYTSAEYEARMYLASFFPQEGPFWEGHLRSIRLVAGGLSFQNIPESLEIWDAGDLLRERDPSTRNIYGIKGGSILEFNSSNFSAADLGVASETERDAVINLVRSGNALPDTVSYLGDIFHSSPLRIGSPTFWFRDDGFVQYRDSVCARTPLIYAGSNTGMLHAFYDETGEEKFALVPENFVPKVKALAVTDSHRFYVDADPMAADVWFPYEDADSFKDFYEWRTVLMAPQGEGGRGITCLEVTDPNALPPTHLFSFYDTANIGYTTSVPAIYKVRRIVDPDTVERFFAFFGGGEWPDSMYNIYSPGSEVRGNVIVAIDVQDAANNVLTQGDNFWYIPAVAEDAGKMIYPFASAASVVNLNSRWDNLYDLLYIADLAGQLWKVDLTDPDIYTWGAKCIFQPPIPADSSEDSLWQPAFYAPLIEREPTTGCLWVFYGTGDRAKVFKTPTDNRFYAILDTITDAMDSYPLRESDLKRLWTQGTFDLYEEFPDYKGWYIVYSDSSTHNNEKTVSRASLFLDQLYFVTFEPGRFSSNCNMGSGRAKEYSYNFRTGSGGFKNMGGGVPQAPKFSFDQSGGAYIVHQTSDSIWVESITGLGTLKRIIQWKER
jgi:hypothetical protein